MPASFDTAHLRVGGGTRGARGSDAVAPGASPRGRRNPGAGVHLPLADGRISAWAEEPTSRSTRSPTRRAHLRVGGGTATEPVRVICGGGASPRGRRNLLVCRALEMGQRRISAWAEEPQRSRGSQPARRAHLRVGGGTMAAVAEVLSMVGASPRGRRNPSTELVRRVRERRISAWAEEPAAAPLVASVGCGASPRGRRNPKMLGSRPFSSRRISAWAEEPSARKRGRRGPGAHLRVGGGTQSRVRVDGHHAGASPRGRRNPSQTLAQDVLERRISAWAEEPLRRPVTEHREGT